MKNFIWNSVAIVFASSITLTTIAQTEHQDTGALQQGAKKQLLSIPKGGLTKESVLSRFGDPSRKEKAVGEPPISVWHYQSYSVYFEYNTVIKSVSHKK